MISLLYNDRQHKGVTDAVPITKCLLRNSGLGNTTYCSKIYTNTKGPAFSGGFYISLFDCIIDIYIYINT